MKIKRLIPLAILCALPWTVSSCLEDIDLDTGERILSVYCVLRNSPEQELELSYMAPVGGTSRPVGEEVTVSLYDGDAPVGQFTRESETKWNLAFSPQGGHTYRLEVKVPGEEVLTAETKFPNPGTLRRVYVQEVEKVKDMSNLAGILPTTGYGIELDSPEDQFLWCYFEPFETVDGAVLPDYVNYIATDHPGVDGRGETIFPYDPDSPVIQEYFDGGLLFRQAGSVLSKEFLGGPVFLHEKLIRIVHPAGFGRPVHDGKLNVFYYDEESHFLFPYKLEEETIGVFGICGVNETLVYADLVINSVSPEYDAYLADYYYGRQDTGDFSKLVYKRNHYSNVRNGAGIFGAICEIRSGKYGFVGKPYYDDLV